ncbi:MAG: hypothetical protein HY897_25110 [Deltaproteobacteria bacterium]|nr:hypothetical protein [Deltaproteobacteria bacterium]
MHPVSHTRAQVIAFIAAALALPATMNAAEAPTLIVFDLVPEKGVERGAANLLTEIVINEVSRLGRYTVIGQKDLDKMLTWEQNKQLKGCNDTSCLIQIAGAMGASFYMEGSLGVMGDQFVVTLKLMDAQNVKIRARDTLIIEKNESVLVKAMPGLVQKIASPVEAKTAPTATAAKEPAPAVEKPAPGDGRGAYRLAGWIAAGTGLAVLGAGVYFWLNAGTTYSDLAAGKYPGADRGDKIDEGKLNDKLGLGGMIGGSVTAALGGVLLYYGYSGGTVAVGMDRGVSLRVGGTF